MRPVGHSAEVTDSVQQSPSGIPVVLHFFLLGCVTTDASLSSVWMAGELCGVADTIVSVCAAAGEVEGGVGPLECQGPQVRRVWWASWESQKDQHCSRGAKYPSSGLLLAP